MRTRRFILIIALLVSAEAFAQTVTFRAGESILLYDNNYFPELFGPKSPRIPTFDLKLGWEDRSDSPYASKCKNPEYGIAFSFNGLGTAKACNGPGVGNIYSLYGYFDRPVIRAKGFSLCYTTGLGIGCCFSHLYDSIDNPWNIMLSYPVNAHINLGLQTKNVIAGKYILGIGAFFTHNSNGAIKFKNKGYNGFELALSVGMKDLRKPEGNEDNSRDPDAAQKDDGFRKGFVYDVHASAGVMSVEAVFDNTLEKTGIGVNERALKYSIHSDVLYKYCRTHASGVGVDLFFTPFCDKIAANDNRGETYRPVSFGVSALHELNYRKITAMVGVGRYFYHNDGLARHKKLYQVVNIRYHLNQYNGLYTGLVLKAHKFMAAESIQLCLGYRF